MCCSCMHVDSSLAPTCAYDSEYSVHMLTRTWIFLPHSSGHLHTLSQKKLVDLSVHTSMYGERQLVCIKLSSYQAIKLSSYQAIKLSSYQAIKLSSYQAIKLSSYQGIKVSRRQNFDRGSTLDCARLC